MRACLAVGFGTIAAVATLSAQVQPVQKVGLIQYLQISHAGVTHDLQAVSSLDEHNADVYITQGPAEAPRSAVLAGLLAHDAEMYGISTVYLRAKNLVPPASRR
jgi:hypothetical protein